MVEDLFGQMLERHALAIEILDDMCKRDPKNAAVYKEVQSKLAVSDFDGVQEVIERYAHALVDIGRTRIGEHAASDNSKRELEALFSRGHVRYEVACEIIGALIAHFADLSGRERSSRVADIELIRSWGQAQDTLREERDALASDDVFTIGRVIQTYAPAVRLLYRNSSVSRSRS